MINKDVAKLQLQYGTVYKQKKALPQALQMFETAKDIIGTLLAENEQLGGPIREAKDPERTPAMQKDLMESETRDLNKVKADLLVNMGAAYKEIAGTQSTADGKQELWMKARDAYVEARESYKVCVGDKNISYVGSIALCCVCCVCVCVCVCVCTQEIGPCC